MFFFKPKFWDRNKISFFSIILLPASLLIRLINLFRRLITKVNKFSIPIICVGNIYLGGTGKTPLCLEIYTILKKINMNPVFIRKKYKSFEDEATLQKNAGFLYQNKKRSEAIKEAIKNKANIAIMDDGFQDFSINKNLSIICFNEKKWIGNGFSIPSGPLREGLSALKRANFVFINGNKNINIENRILKKNKKIKIFYTKHLAKNANDFKNKQVLAFAGIGNPTNFFSLLRNNNINVIEKIEFPDHYNYSKNDIKNLKNKAKSKNAILLTTEKDFLRVDKRYNENIYSLKITVEIENKNQFIEEIKKAI